MEDTTGYCSAQGQASDTGVIPIPSTPGPAVDICHRHPKQMFLPVLELADPQKHNCEFGPQKLTTYQESPYQGALAGAAGLSAGAGPGVSHQ